MVILCLPRLRPWGPPTMPEIDKLLLLASERDPLKSLKSDGYPLIFAESMLQRA
jgi:hypothetical protein